MKLVSHGPTLQSPHVNQMDVKVRALPLLAISDHISRNPPFRFGALVGIQGPNSLLVIDAFDIKHDEEQIDTTLLSKKISLLQTVSPKTILVGVYSCDENSKLPAMLKAQLAELTPSQPLIYLAPSEKTFACYLLESGEKIAFSLIPGEAEVTAVSTVQNHANYSQKECDLTQQTETSLGPSFRQMEEHVKFILATECKDPETERQIVHLAQLVSNYKHQPTADSLEIETAHLSLLAAQIATAKCANAQVNTQTAAMSKRGYRDWRPN
ncbi:hypothetical protein OXX80_004255 [Metschnikowia pulcherrima]